VFKNDLTATGLSFSYASENGVLEQDPLGNFLLAKNNLEDSFLKEADQDQNPENIFSGVLEDRLLAWVNISLSNC